MKQTPLKTRVRAGLIAYGAGSYAYGLAFMVCSGVGFSPSQIVLLAASPVWLLLHVPLTVVCTIQGLHGSWNTDNTVSSLSFAGAALFVWVATRTRRNRNRHAPRLGDVEATHRNPDLVAKHLAELKALRDARIAARFELVADQRWLRRQFAANERLFEVRWIDDGHLQLDLIALVPSFPMPGEWRRELESRWVIPVSQTDGLSEWINAAWSRIRGTTGKVLRMWTE